MTYVKLGNSGVMEALHDVVKSGKARYIGACTMDAWQFERLQNIAERNHWTKFITMQNQYNLIYREEEHEMMPLCLDRKEGSSRQSGEGRPRKWPLYGAGSSSWMLSKPFICSPVVGTTSVKHVEEAASAVDIVLRMWLTRNSTRFSEFSGT